MSPAEDFRHIAAQLTDEKLHLLQAVAEARAELNPTKPGTLSELAERIFRADSILAKQTAPRPVQASEAALQKLEARVIEIADEVIADSFCPLCGDTRRTTIALDQTGDYFEFCHRCGHKEPTSEDR